MKQSPNKYGSVIKKIGERKYIRRQINWDKEISYILEKISESDIGVSDSCIIVPGLLMSAAESYFTDIVRLKEFHVSKRVRDEKILAYSVYWLLQNRPVQIADYANLPAHRYHINEDVLSTWLIMRLSRLILKRTATKIQIDDFELKFNNSEFVIEFRKTLRYNFVYRTYTAQTILLMIEGFITAVEFTLQIT